MRPTLHFLVCPRFQAQAHLTRDLCSLVVLVQPDQDSDQPTHPDLKGQAGDAGADTSAAAAADQVLQAVAYNTDILQHPHIQQLAVLAMHLRQVVAGEVLCCVTNAEWGRSEQQTSCRSESCHSCGDCCCYRLLLLSLLLLLLPPLLLHMTAAAGSSCCCA